MTDLKKLTIIKLLEKQFFTKLPHQQVKEIEPAINNAFINQYNIYNSNIEKNKTLLQNFIELSKVIDEKSYEAVGIEIIFTILEFLSYIKGEKIYWENGEVVETESNFYSPIDMKVEDALEKLLNEIENFNYLNTKSLVHKKVIKNIFE